MHWAVIPLLVTAVSAAAVEPAAESEAGDREGKRKKYESVLSSYSTFIFFYFQCSASFKLSNSTTMPVMLLMGLWEPATRPLSVLPMEEKREETVPLVSVSVAWVSQSPIQSQFSVPTCCRMSQTRVSLSNIHVW